MGGQQSKTEYKPSEGNELLTYEAKEGPFWMVEPDANRPVRLAQKGAASKQPTTVINALKVMMTL